MKELSPDISYSHTTQTSRSSHRKPVNNHSLPHDALKSILEPLDRLSLVDAVGSTNSGLASPALGNTFTRSGPI
jgi:hypothetical protein